MTKAALARKSSTVPMPPKRPGLLNSPFVIFDCETGGTNPSYHPILSIGYTIIAPVNGGYEPILKKSFLIKPYFPRRLDPEAIKVNGYTPKKWLHAFNEKQVMEEFVKDTVHCIFTAQNVAFDWPFVDEALRRHKLIWLGSYHRLDTLALAWPLVVTKRIPSASLANITKYFDIIQENPHEALSDALDCQGAFTRLLDGYVKLINANPEVFPIKKRARRKKKKKNKVS